MFPYWIRLLENGQPLTEPRCLLSQPTWMADHAGQLGQLAIGDLMLVYSHDSAAYKSAYALNLTRGVL